MLRRIHDPERGASFAEYAGVVVLAAAIVAVLAFSGLGGRVAGALQGAVASVLDGGPGGEGPGDGGSGGEGSGDGGPGGEESGDGGPGGEESGGEGPERGPGVAPVAGPGEAAGDGGGGGFWAGLGNGLADVAGGVWDAGADFVGGIGQGLSDLWQQAQDLWNDPGGWLADTWDSALEGLGATWEGLTGDPGGFVLDLLFSDEVQRDWEAGERLHAAAQGLAENLIGLIPVVGWYKKGDRVGDVLTGPGRRNDTGDAPVRADGNGPPGRRRDDGDGAGARPCAVGNSFAAGTPVLLADGTLAPIESVGVGQQVWAFDPADGAEGPREVTGVVTGQDTRVLVEVAVDDGDGGRGVVVATEGHPLWAPELARWVAAGELEPGTWLRTSAGSWVRVAEVRARTAREQVYNLTVAGLHTYYVAAGTTTLLAHNSTRGYDCDGGDLDDVLDGIYERYPPEVADGVEYNVNKAASSDPHAQDHVIAGTGRDPWQLAEYLSQWPRSRSTHTDTRSGNRVAYDDSRKDADGRGVLIVWTPYNVHAYHMSRSDFEDYVAKGNYVKGPPP